MKKIYSAISHNTKLKAKSVSLILSLFIFLFGMAPGEGIAQSISVTNVITTPVCAGSDVTITFDVTNGGTGLHFDNSTLYQIYLSDTTGTVFTPQGTTFNNSSQTYDGTDGGTTSGLFQTFTIPAGTPAGAGYEISIGSTVPTFDGSTGTGASTAFTIDAIPATPGAITGAAADCDNTSGNPYSITAVPGATGYTWAYSGTGATIVGSGTSITINFAAGATSGNLTVTADNTCGSSAPQTLAITVNAIPATPGAITGTAADCDNTSGNPYSITAVPGATGYTWAYSGTGATINGTGTNITIDFATGATSGTLSVTADNTCGSSAPQTQAITVNPNPTANAGGALAAICQGATSAAMGGSVGGGATGGTWSGGAGTWTNANDPVNATYTAGAAESGSITLTLTTSGGSCGTTTATKTITVNQNPTANAGGALSAICQGATSAAMGGSVGGGATGGTWTGGAGTWTNANDPANATYTAGAAESGSITLTLTTSGGSCGTTSDTKTITVNQDPTANAGGALSAICQGATSAAMAGSVGGGATGGTWSGGAGTWTNANDPANATYTAGAAESGSITLTLTTSGGSCGTTSDTKTITVNQDPTANAGGALSAICQGATSAAMAGSVGGGATGGTWSGGAGTWTNANDPANATYTAGAAESGSITLTLTTSGGLCGTTTDSKTITVNPNPTANAGGALAAICQGATSAAMGGSVGGGATGGTWTGGAGTWTNANNPATATYTAGAAESGSITLTLTTSGGSCGTTTVTKTITVNPNPTANAGGALAAICQGATSAAMGGSVGGGATGGTWSGGAGTWTNANNPATATYTAGAAESGSITLTLTTNGGSCGTTTATKTITVNQNPTANAGSALAAICQGATSAAMGGSVGGGATGGTWSGGAGTWTNANNPANATYTAGAAESGSITLTLTTSGGSCGTTTVTKTITVNPNPTANAGGALAAICQGATSAAMGGSVGGGATGGTWSGGAGTWTNANNPATATYTAGAAESGSITLTLTTNGGSCGTTTATKTITVNQNPTANAGSALAAICQGATSAAMGGSVGGGATGGTWSGGAGTWTNANNPATATYTAGAAESGSITLTLTTSGGSCGTTTATKTITVNQSPTANAGGALAAICQGATSAAMGGSVGGGATGGTWSGGAGTWTNANNPATATYTAGAAESGSITLTLTTSGGSCGTTTVTKTITVNPNPTANAGGALAAICQGATSAAMGGSVGGGATGGTWSGGAGTWTNANNPATATYTAGAAESGSITLTLTTSGGSCGTTTATKTITVNQSPTANAGGALAAICQGATSAAMGGSVGGGATGGTWSGGAGTWTNANNPATATYTAGAAESGSITLTLTTSGGSCGTTTATKTITVNAPPPTTGVTICQGGSGSLTSSAACAASTPGTAGPNPAGTGATGGAGTAWVNPGNVKLNDNIYTTVTGTGTAFSQVLSATNFGFAIPATAIINGIQVTIQRFSNTSGILDNSVKLIQGGVVVGNNHASATTWPTAKAAANYGTTGDLWSTTWTPAQINAANFGVSLVVSNSSNFTSRTASVDYITITVSYTIPGTLNWYTVSSGGSAIGNGTPFNPVPSGLANTNTPGTYIFYAECTAAAPGCRTATNFVINPNPTIGGNLTICTSGSTTTQLTGSGTPAASNPWVSGTPGVATVNSTGLVTAVSAGTTVITYTNNNGCQATATVTVQQPTITGTFTVCTGNTTQLTGSGTPAATNPWVSGTPAVATVSNSGLVTGVTAGTSVITYTNNNGCTASATVTVNANSTITLTSAPATTSQTVCINTAITPITYQIGGGGTGATLSGQPAGITGSYNSGTKVYTVSGTPTSSGTFNYTVTTTGPCVNPSLSGTITVQPNSTLTLTSGTASQTVCINNAITTVKYTIGGSATGASLTSGSFPAGVTGSFAGGVFTISGTPTAAGSFPYTITTSGPCVNVSLSGTITVNDNATITLTSAPATTSQTVCINTAITQITYQIGGGGTGATLSGQPAGVSGTYNSGTKIFTISGTPTTSGTFNYTVTTTGPCIKPTATGTIIVTPNATIALSSAVGTDGQTVCQNSAIVNITYTVGGSGTGATVSGLPAGVTGSFSGSTFTITGTPTASGTFNYTVTTTGPCTQATASGTITVNPQPSGTLTATETSGTANNDNIICKGATVTFTFSNSTYGSYIFKLNGTTVQTGTSNTYSNNTLNNGDAVTVDVANGFNCGATFGPVTITVNPLPTPTLSANKTSICPGDNVTFTAGGGTNYNFKVNGSSVQSGASNTYSSTTLTNGASVTVDVTDGNSCVATSSPVVITVNSLPSGTLSATTTTICAGSSITFTATAGFTTYNFKVNGVSVQNSGSNTYTTTTLTNGQVVTVDVTNASGCTATFNPPQVITVNALPAGSVTATENSGTPNDNTICAGSSVTFTATAGAGNTYKFYLNGTGGALQSGSSNVYTTTTLVNNDYITVVVTNSSNCSSTYTSPNITVIPLPTGTLTASANPICSGDNIDFTATTGYLNYNFKVNGTSFQNGSSNTASHSGFANGDVVTVDVTGAGTCTATFNSLTINVNALPTGTLSVTENSGTTPNDGIICTGANVTFTASTGFANYNFKINNITVQFGAANTYNTNTLANGDVVSVEVTNGSGCVATFNTITITVNTIPPVAAITGPGAVCVNSIITLSDATAGGTWSSNNSSIAAVDASGNVTGVGAGVATISYKVTNAGGCDSTVTKNITVNALPPNSPITGTFNVCVNSTTQLTDATSGGAWSSSNTAVATVDNTGLVNGITPGNIEIYYTTTDGVTGCISIDSANVIVNALPVVNAITGTLSVCVNNTTTLSDATSGGTWSSSDGTIATINSSGVVTGVSAGSVTISYSVTNANGCNTTVTANVTVNPLPVPTLNGPNPICPNATDTYTTEAGQSNYAWAFTGGTLVSGGTATDNTITITWDQPGARTISVNYQNSFGCSGATSATVLTSTGTTPTLSGTSPVCLNATGNYTTQSGFTNYTWSATGGTITPGTAPNDNTATVNWTTVGAGSVSINFTDGNGCTAASPTILPVTVHSLPTASISGNSSVCVGAATQQVTFTGASGAIPYTFTYTINGGSNQTVTTTSGNSITVNQNTGTAGSYTYTLVSVSDNNGCSQPQAGSVTITVNPLATGTISGTGSVCQNSTSPNITFTGTAGTAPFTFKYNINGGATQTITTVSGNSVTVAAPTGTSGNFAYNLVSVSDANGCLNPQGGTATITVNPNPTATISGTTSVCISSASPNITFTGANGTAPYTFTYNINGGLPLTAVSNLAGVATVPASTLVAGTFTYNLVSVVDASTTLCSQPQSGSATVTVTPASVGGSLASNATVCSGSNTGTINLSGQTGNVIRWESSIDNFVTITTIANTTTSLTYNNITQTTQYRAVVQSGTCTSANSSVVTITVNPVSVGGTVSANQTICSGTTPANLTLSGNTGSVVKWQRATDAAFATAVDIANTTTTLTGASIGALATTTYFRAVVQSGVCAPVNSAAVTITVNPLPTATISGTVSVCQNATSPNVTFTGANGTAPYTFTYNINGGGPLTVTSVGNIATVAAPTGTVGTFVYNLVSVKDASSTTCSNNQSGSATITVNAPPPAFVITPASATICLGTVQPLSAGANSSSSGSMTFNSTNNNLSIPDNSTTGVASTINVSGIPAGAVITSVSAKFNITHGYDADLVLNLKAPNSNTLNLVNQRGGNGANFTNTNISSASVNPISGGAAPFTNTYAADRANNVGATGYVSNVTTFPSLYSTPNGNWSFSAEDVTGCEGFVIFGFCVGGDYSGILNNWSLTINYNIPTSPLAVTWSPTTDLYTDPGATTAYTGTSLSTVYANPATSGTKTYTATATNAAGCSTSQNVVLTVNPTPVVTITANYCDSAGHVHLTANVSPAATSYLWSTGATTQSIYVDESDVYTVTAFTALSCPGSATINVAHELVVNGDFEAGGLRPTSPIGFTSDYVFKADTYLTFPGLNPPGQGILYDDSGNNAYSITPSGQDTHINFWGYDHTTGTATTPGGNFMAVNGHGNTLVVWKETVNVLPNTTYYFSAWAMSLNNAGPFAQLQFSVNGTLVGTTAVLAAGQNNNSNNGWIRFYGTWTSGPATTSAQIYINDLQAALGGNDFGLDDISFATLSTFIDLESGPGTDAQTICVNTPLTNIVYSVGNGNPTGPNVTGLPAGVTSVFAGDELTISGTPTVAGNYTYTITTTGCAPYSVTGTITVQQQKLTLTSGSPSPTVCINTAMTNIVYTASGPVTNVTATGLPTGVTGTYNAGSKTFTISGSPSVAGTFKDTVVTVGTCKADTAYGTITVQNQTIVLSSGPSTQTVCVNNAITTVVYTVGGTGTGAGVTGLPPGVTGFYSGGSFIISGTPTSAGTYNYTVTTTGTCNPGAVATGTITVNPAASIALSSAAGTDAQTVCINTAITNITYTTGGTATGASITSGSLPAGVTGSFSGGVFTISGTPTVAGIFNYTITATGTCASATISGTITVQSQTIVLTSGNASPTLCMGSTLTNIVFTIGGTGTGAVLTGSLPTGITGIYDVPTKTFTISGSPSQLGTFNYTVTTTGSCSPAAALSGTITVNSGSVGGTLTPSVPAICSGGGGILNLLGQTGNIVHWESSTDGFTTITIIANTTSTLSYSAVTVPTQYRVLVKSGSCTGVYSSVATVTIHNYWTGATGTDWNTAANWSDNLVPSTICPDVYVPNQPNKPVLSAGPTSTITNLHILAGAQVTINGTGLMQIGGTISNAGVFDVSSGAIEFNGTSPQTIAANTFLNNAINDLIITNSAGTGVTLGGAQDVYRSLTYGKNGAILNTGGFLTLKSGITQTAWIGDMTNHTINGNVTVERYIATGPTGAPNHGKSWQLLGIPDFGGQTINAAWQEGATTSDVVNPTAPSTGNPVAGYGTMITSDVAGTAQGFDAQTAAGTGPSIKVYNAVTTGYNGPANTTGTPIYNQKGYFVFVRGDRSITSAFVAANPTILRTKGTLFTPANTPPVTNVAPNTFESVGNPYASAIDMRTISKPGVDDFFYVWDPRLGGQNGYGAFQTLYKSGSDYLAIPGGTITYGSGPIDYIQSGQAFLVHNSNATPGTVNFAETNKANGSALFTTPNPVNQVQQILITNLSAFNADGTTSLADGVLSNFDNAYSNAVDGMDARKSINTGENLAIKTGGKLLAIERRQPPTSQDTIFLNITGEKAQQYRFHFDAENLDPSVQGILVDSYTNTHTPLNMIGSTDVNFTVANVTGSNAANRFMIVFEPLKALPVTFTSITAYKQDKNIDVQWRVDNEVNIKQYEVDKSTDGNQFTAIATKQPTANNGGSAVYVIADTNPVEGFNYYRVKSLDVNGKTSYTSIVKVLIGSLKQDITIYPNPITDGMIHLQFRNEDAGKYHIRLLNKLGQLILQQQFTHAGGDATDLIKWDYNLAHGMYQLEITKPDGSLKDINVMY